MTLPDLFKITLSNWSAKSVMAHSLNEQLILAACQTSHWLTKKVGEDNIVSASRGALKPSHEACECEMDTFLTLKKFTPTSCQSDL